ncbi:MAG: DUF190 domain-containing protein [Spirochaetota bacterium]|nr:DUF190 domain-containing protein [Spirochaetota bacterium]
MKITGVGQLIRVFLGESDKYHGKPVYECIVLKARELGLAGSTVIKGIEGFGATSRIHTAKILRLSEDLPVILEIVDTVERIKLIKEEIDKIFEESGCGGMITVEDVEIIKYAPKK